VTVVCKPFDINACMCGSVNTEHCPAIFIFILYKGPSTANSTNQITEIFWLISKHKILHFIKSNLLNGVNITVIVHLELKSLFK
jgi:hypothetical protein